MYLFEIDVESGKSKTLLEFKYPYGDTSFDTRNVSFYVRGQYGDVVFDLTRAEVDSSGRLWVTDFLSGKLFIVD